jgi:hypothetical protein
MHNLGSYLAQTLPDMEDGDEIVQRSDTAQHLNLMNKHPMARTIFVQVFSW